MEYAAKTAKLKFILNVVINGEKKIINAFAGDLIKAHRKGCEFVKSLCMEKAIPADAKATNELKNKEEAKQFRISEDRKAAQQLAEKINGVELDIQMGHGQDGRLYGSVTVKDVAGALKAKIGADIDKRKITIKENIKAYGSYSAEVKLFSDVVAKFIVRVHE